VPRGGAVVETVAVGGSTPGQNTGSPSAPRRASCLRPNQAGLRFRARIRCPIAATPTASIRLYSVLRHRVRGVL
jgi:hypothetical protein